MSTSLAIQADGDVEIWPFSGVTTGHGDVLVDLWKILRQTSVDVAQSPTQSVWDWAESCVYIAEVMNFIKASAPLQDQKSVAPDHDSSAWTRVEKTWWAPTTFGFRDPQTSQTSPRDFSYVQKDFYNRVTKIPEDVQNLGPLREYAPLYLTQQNIPKLYHVYLYDHILLFVNDLEHSSPVSSDVPRSSPLNVVGVVHLVDIKDIYHNFRCISDYAAYGLTFSVDMTDNSRHDMSLILPTPQSLWNWSTALRQRMSGEGRPAWTLTQTDFLAKGMLAVTEWPFKAVPLHRYGGLQKYAPVIIRNGKTTAQVGAYLFEKHLVFICKTRQGSLEVLRDVHLAHIAKVYKQARTVGLILEGNDPQPWRVNLHFECDYRTSASNWVSMLQKGVQEPKRRSSKQAPAATTVAPTDPDWDISGVVALSASADNESEYNIVVAIHPKKRHDGLASYAVAVALGVAFETLGAHRVQARVLHGAGPIVAQDAVSRFIHWGFTHEGTRRRVVVNPTDNNWVDMSVLSLLDTEWALRAAKRPPEQTPWDELFVRHQRERDALLMVAGETQTQRDKFPNVTPTQSAASDVENISVPDSRFARSVVEPLSLSDNATGSSWAAVLDGSSNTNAEVMPAQIRRWIEQQTVEPPDSLQSVGLEDSHTEYDAYEVDGLTEPK